MRISHGGSQPYPQKPKDDPQITTPYPPPQDFTPPPPPPPPDSTLSPPEMNKLSEDLEDKFQFVP